MGLHLRGLAERGSILYGAANNTVDGVAVVSSLDGGNTWKPVLTFSQICRPADCVATSCAASWQVLDNLLQIESPMSCLPPGSSEDMAHPVTDLKQQTHTAPPAGCSCRMAGRERSSESIGPWTALFLFSALLRRRKNSRWRPRSPSWPHGHAAFYVNVP